MYQMIMILENMRSIRSINQLHTILVAKAFTDNENYSCIPYLNSITHILIMPNKIKLIFILCTKLNTP